MIFLKCFRRDAFKMFQERLQDPSRRPKGAQHGPRSPSKASPGPRPKAGFHGCCWLQAFKTLQERPQDPSRWPKDVLKGLWGELPRVGPGGAGAPPGPSLRPIIFDHPNFEKSAIGFRNSPRCETYSARLENFLASYWLTNLQDPRDCLTPFF